ncbi:aconitate hydratase [Sphaerosporella brunnea]|uniref:Large ribosomal subunit protein bL21m n=1 Tax=Sphaerosporella brunnea TaxID=1250544 RepID=A0A5J5F0J3_9PEZI|nr:aconitate hydratase [Sphaerosporella brunnea]
MLPPSRLLFRPLASAAVRPATQHILRPAAAFGTSSVFRQQQQQQLPNTPTTSAIQPATPTTTTTTTTTTATTTTTPAPLSHETLKLLPLLLSQPQHYITIHIHAFPFLVTAGDTVTLPFRLKGVTPGQTLRLTHASVLGSRDYTLKGAPYLDERLFRCHATVVAETAEPMRVKEKTKRRQRKIKKVKSKHVYTVLRIKEVVVRNPFVEGAVEQVDAL